MDGGETHFILVVASLLVLLSGAYCCAISHSALLPLCPCISLFSNISFLFSARSSARPAGA